MTILQYPQELRAISIHAPFAYAICLGKKTAEYRSRSTSIRGWILIHASKSTQSDDYFEHYGISPNVERGCTNYAANLYDCEGEGGSYSYHLKEPKLFRERFSIKGKQSIFWKAADATEQRIFAAAWALINKEQK